MRRIIKASMNEEEFALFEFLKQRLAEPDTSKALKKSIILTHNFIDHIQKEVPQPMMTSFLDNLKYKEKPYIDTLENWRKERQRKQSDIL
jgi:hypothetical protein